MQPQSQNARLPIELVREVILHCTESSRKYMKDRGFGWSLPGLELYLSAGEWPSETIPYASLLYLDKSTLAVLCRVSKALYKLTQPFLYRHVLVHDSNAATSLFTTLETTHAGRHCLTLDLAEVKLETPSMSWPKRILAIKDVCPSLQAITFSESKFPNVEYPLQSCNSLLSPFKEGLADPGPVSLPKHMNPQQLVAWPETPRNTRFPETQAAIYADSTLIYCGATLEPTCMERLLQISSFKSLGLSLAFRESVIQSMLDNVAPTLHSLQLFSPDNKTIWPIRLKLTGFTRLTHVVLDCPIAQFIPDAQFLYNLPPCTQEVSLPGGVFWECLGEMATLLWDQKHEDAFSMLPNLKRFAFQIMGDFPKDCSKLEKPFTEERAFQYAGKFLGDVSTLARPFIEEDAKSREAEELIHAQIKLDPQIMSVRLGDSAAEYSVGTPCETCWNDVEVFALVGEAAKSIPMQAYVIAQLDRICKLGGVKVEVLRES